MKQPRDQVGKFQPISVAKRNKVTTRYTDDEMIVLQRFAEAWGMPISNVQRQMVLHYLDELYDDAAADVAARFEGVNWGDRTDV